MIRASNTNGFLLPIGDLKRVKCVPTCKEAILMVPTLDA